MNESMMSNKQLIIKNLSISFPHKICFENFSTTVYQGSKIAIIGRNGSGKSTLLKILYGISNPSGGTLDLPSDLRCSYVPQIVTAHEDKSGGQRFNCALTKALSNNPHLLLLDEPTNHLDHANRVSLMRMLKRFSETLIVVTHDAELLRNCIDTLWHIDDQNVHLFSGSYDDYILERDNKRASITQQLSALDREKASLHLAHEKEQKRSSKSRAKGKKKVAQKRWMPSVGKDYAASAEKSSGKKDKVIDKKKQVLTEQRGRLRLPDVIVPSFSLSSFDSGLRTILSVADGSVGYGESAIVKKINLTLCSSDRIALLGNNGSGKSTVLKAILGKESVMRTGTWDTPKTDDIGNLDQQYATLCERDSVVQTISQLVPSWAHSQVRQHLNKFLFRKNEEVNARVATLSGGEKARLSLAQIGAKTPKLLILDEITNNLDLETKGHVVEALKEYPGAMIVVSHDDDFLEAIGIQDRYLIQDGIMKLEA